MDYPGSYQRDAVVNRWQVSFSLTAYAEAHLGLLVSLVSERIKSSNQNLMRAVSRDILVSRLLSCSAGFYRLPCESVKPFFAGYAVCPRLSWLVAHAFAGAMVNPWHDLLKSCNYFPSVYAGNSGKTKKSEKRYCHPQSAGYCRVVASEQPNPQTTNTTPQ